LVSIAETGNKRNFELFGLSIKIIVANFLQQVAAKSLRFATERLFSTIPMINDLMEAISVLCQYVQKKLIFFGVGFY
jgi:hypothetical protein